MTDKESPHSSAKGVVAVVVTYRRPFELRRLLDGLSHSNPELLACVVVDHAADGEAARLVETFGPAFICLENPANPGPGGGWAKGAEYAMQTFGRAVAAIWYLDDDVVVAPDTLEILWREMELADAQVIAPLLSDHEGRLWAFPEPRARSLRKIIRRVRTPKEARALLGETPLEFCWATGACLLVRRSAVEAAGKHRLDFFMLGEDLEYAMRLAGKVRAVFTPLVDVPHLPLLAGSAAGARRADYRKFCALLQNLSYLAFHSPDSAHMKWYLPGNFRRFFRNYGFQRPVLRDAWSCFVNGAIRAEPAGMESGQRLRERIACHAFLG